MQLGKEEHAEGLKEVLRVALRHTSLFERTAFRELASAVAAVAPFDRMAVLVADGPGHARLYTPDDIPEVVAFGVRFPLPEDAGSHAVLARGAVYRQDDTRRGHALDRAAAAAGLLSYVLVPIREPGAPNAPVRGEVVIAFREAGAAKDAPIAFYEEVAEIIGMHLARAGFVARDRRLAMILETSGDAMLAWDRGGLVTDANGAAAALVGVARDALIGRPIRELLDALPDPATCSPAQGLRLHLSTPSGTRIPVAATITTVEDDPLVAAHALLRDLTAVVAAEREAAQRLARIRALEEHHRTLLDNLPLVVFQLDPHTTELVYLNRHAERLLGEDPKDAVAISGFLRRAHADPDGVRAFDDAVACAQRGVRHAPYEARLRRGEGEFVTVRATVYPLVDESGEVVAIEGILADVSADHAARTRLVQTDRLSTLGTLSAGVAHEINNPAAFILLGLDMLDRVLRQPGVRLDEGPAREVDSLIEELRDSIRRIVDIARDLRHFASPPAAPGGRKSFVDVNRTIESALTLTRGQILERAQIACRLGDLPPVLMEDGRLGQVIVNLLVNAAQAIPKSYERDNHAITIVTRTHGDDVVEIEVTDTGVGIARGDLHRIWEPFFTTKSPDVGTGLGLSISREIVERAGGTIRVESPVFDPDETGAEARFSHPYGSRFVIALPAAGRAEIRSDPPASQEKPELPSRPRARVLVIEDEPALARALAEEIGRVHEVVLADGATGALHLLGRQRFDAVLCDLRMPGMAGDTLYARVREIDEAQARRFVFMTGVGFGTDVERFLAQAGRPVLEKPFSAGAALEAIAKVASE